VYDINSIKIESDIKNRLKRPSNWLTIVNNDLESILSKYSSSNIDSSLLPTNPKQTTNPLAFLCVFIRLKSDSIFKKPMDAYQESIKLNQEKAKAS
jgi:hypothetical protein